RPRTPRPPAGVGGPFGPPPPTTPGVRVCEHLPLQASIMDRLAIIRSVDCRSSTDHYPAPMQTGNPLAQRRGVGEKTATHPSMGSVAARFRGPNDPALPAFVGFADPGLFFADVLGAGPLGGTHDAVEGDTMAGRLALPPGVTAVRAEDRMGLSRQLDRFRGNLDTGDMTARLDDHRKHA